MKDKRRLVDAFYAHWSGGAKESRNYWAVEEVMELAKENARGFLELLPELAASAPSDDALGYLAAGALENFVVWNGQENIDMLEEMALQDPTVRKSVTMVWRRPEIPESVWRRIRGIADASGK